MPLTGAVLVPVALAVPRETSRVRPARSESRISAVASTGSRERPERPGEDVGRAARDDGQHRQVRRRPVAQQPVDDLVDGAVAADGHDDVDAVGGRLGAELAGVPAVRGLDDVELELAAEGADEDVAHLGAWCWSPPD